MDTRTFLSTVPEEALGYVQMFAKIMSHENDIPLPAGYDSRNSFPTEVKTIFNMQSTINQQLVDVSKRAQETLQTYFQNIHRSIMLEGHQSIARLDVLNNLSRFKDGIEDFEKQLDSLSQRQTSAAAATTTSDDPPVLSNLRTPGVRKTFTTKKKSRSGKSKHRAPWTDEEMDLLKRLKRQGYSVRGMVEYFPGRTYNAIMTRATVMKLNFIHEDEDAAGPEEAADAAEREEAAEQISRLSREIRDDSNPPEVDNPSNPNIKDSSFDRVPSMEREEHIFIEHGESDEE